MPWTSNGLVAGGVVAGILAALLFSGKVADRNADKTVEAQRVAKASQDQRPLTKGTRPPPSTFKRNPPPREYQPDCSKREEAYLCAQRRMADAAEGQRALLIVGLGLLLGTLFFSGWAAISPRHLSRVFRATKPEATDAARAVAITRELAATKTTINVMFLYTRKVAAKYVDVETDLIAHAIEEANASFSNSGIGNIALRLAHSEQTDYAEADKDHFNHLYCMVGGVGAFESVRALRNQCHADVVVLLVDDTSGCGLATRVAADAEESFVVVHHACAGLRYHSGQPPVAI